MAILIKSPVNLTLGELDVASQYLTAEERKHLLAHDTFRDPKTIEDYAYVESLKHMLANGRKLEASERLAFRLGYMAGFEQKFK
jgi:hypothetical protein